MISRKILSFFLLGLTICSCMKPQAAPPPPQSAPIQDFRHTVRYQGETLAAIARWYTGSGNQWQAIRDANPQLDPRRLKLGTEVVIPHELLVRTDPFPKPGGAAQRTAKKDSRNTNVTAGASAPSAEVQNAAAEEAPPGPSDEEAGTVAIQEPPSAPSVDDSQGNGAVAVNDQAAPPVAPDAPPATTEGAGVAAAQPAENANGGKGGIVAGLLQAVGRVAIDSKKQDAPAGE
jgi:hypothetical protein